MPALNFKPQFVAKIQHGSKRTTIRAIGKRTIKEGDFLYLYTGQRTANCKLIGTAYCSDISLIRITEAEIRLQLGVYEKIKWLRVDHDALKSMYENDGFSSFVEMRDFFRKQYGLPFEGQLIEWRNFLKA